MLRAKGSWQRSKKECAQCMAESKACSPSTFHPVSRPRVTWRAKDATTETSRAFRVWGFIGAPEEFSWSRGSTRFRKSQTRGDRGLNFALLEGYHTSLMKGAIRLLLFVEMNPVAVDVNIHPQSAR